ncbi:MAG: (d)CMP kinase [Thermoplasmata archaeon]|nr:(d)CMP kinase [Thermoplasmata archaeon]
MARSLVIAIDGPSGAGKSTAGRALASRLGYVFVDTGAMYRALALKALRAGVPLDDGGALGRLAHDSKIELTDGGCGVSLDGEDATAAIRSREVSAAASRVSVHPAVRREMVLRQREMGGHGGVVLDGRDIGTAVFPSADVKFYVDADPVRRARRRADELAAAGSPFDLAAIEREIRDRDHADMTRPDSPLTRAPDAVLLDTTDLTPEQVLERMWEAVTGAASRTRRRS